MRPKHNIRGFTALLSLLAFSATAWCASGNPQASKPQSPTEEERITRADDHGGQTLPKNIHLPTLVAAGVRLDDVSALTQIIRTRHRLAVSAAFALGLLPPSEEAVRALNEALESENDVLVLYSAEALVKYGEKAWVRVGQERLPSLPTRASQLDMAGLLAKAGCYDGWGLVTKTLTDPELDRTTIFEALLQVPSFAGMKDASGNPVELAEELRTILPKAQVRHRELIMRAIKQLTPSRPVKQDIPGPLQ